MSGIVGTMAVCRLQDVGYDWWIMMVVIKHHTHTICCATYKAQGQLPHHQATLTHNPLYMSGNNSQPYIGK